MGAKDQGVEPYPTRWLVSARTLIFLTCGDEILLMKRSAKKRIFPGRYNGLGGHLERDEDPLAGALRELAEEAGLQPQRLALRAVSHIDAGGPHGVLIFVFCGECTTRDLPIRQSEEGELSWLPLAQLSELDLVEDLPHLLPRILGEPAPSAAPLFAHLHYNEADCLQFHFHGETNAE